VVANAENAGVPVASVVNRDGWTSEISLVGHQAPVEVALFNPVLFQLPDHVQSENRVTGVCALGSQDCGLSVWWTSVAKPAVALTNVSTQGVLDLTWYLYMYD
jgi:protein HIRA/HIR1